MPDDSNDQPKSAHSSVIYRIGLARVVGLYCMAGIAAFLTVFSVLENPQNFFQDIKAYFAARQYAAPIATGIFLTIFSANLYRTRSHNRAVLNYLGSLALASFFTYWLLIYMADIIS